jgi:hypothetical protein
MSQMGFKFKAVLGFPDEVDIIKRHLRCKHFIGTERQKY